MLRVMRRIQHYMTEEGLKLSELSLDWAASGHMTDDILNFLCWIYMT